MTKADEIFKKAIAKILTEGCMDENPRPKYKDGTPAHSLFITQHVEEFDISKGEFPISTLRPIAIKSAINEILAIYQSQTNTLEGFEKHGCHWWSEWMNEEGNLGRAYAYNLESHRSSDVKREVVKVKKIKIDKKYAEKKEINLVRDIQPSVDGEIYNNEGNPFVIIDKKHEKASNGNYFYLLQFITTGNTKKIRSNDFKRSMDNEKIIKDNFSRSYYNIGYLGDYKNTKFFTKEEKEKLIIKWESIFKRCYGKQGEQNKKNYQEKGVFVHQNWHSFENFLKTIMKIPNFFLAREDKFEGWDLDKDYFGGNCYSEYTCTFLKRKENALYAKGRPIKITEKETGKQKIFLEIGEVAEFYNFSKSGLKTALYRTERLERGIYKKYEFEFLKMENDGLLYRYEISKNQLNELIKGLKEEPYSRRHWMSFFNLANQDKKTLVECAFQTLWSVRNVSGEMFLDCTLTMRSSDKLIAGIGINQMQYVALQMMIAHELGMKPGKFVRFVQNLHIYDRHVDQAKELLQREGSQKQPKLILNAEGKGFYDITVDDFEIIDYEPQLPQLKFDLGI